eukprot:TRINITY_DN6495_c0_g1_i1.p1 TRINITY_DN6495_c0_g1~~TRINITY_DN6495_c0_g1_i1.p1  ORF type:complete len:146 (+),score=9.52 TRINITY_DN6495_c0_g1_i1:150-587(+)
MNRTDSGRYSRSPMTPNRTSRLIYASPSPNGTVTFLDEEELQPSDNPLTPVRYSSSSGTLDSSYLNDTELERSLQNPWNRAGLGSKLIVIVSATLGILIGYRLFDWAMKDGASIVRKIIPARWATNSLFGSTIGKDGSSLLSRFY